jgi:hypothetical protein
MGRYTLHCEVLVDGEMSMLKQSLIGRFVAIQERSNGNEQVGDMWLETKVFPPETTIEELWRWANGGAVTGHGRLMIRPDAGSVIEGDLPF